MSRRRGEHSRIANDLTTFSIRQASRQHGHRLLRCGLAFIFLLSGAALASAQQLDIVSATPGAEGGPDASIRIGLTPAAAVDIMFDYNVMDGTADASTDFGATFGVAMIPAGNTNIVINVPILDDGIAEGTENFRFTISNPTGGVTLGVDTTLVDIFDNEGPVTLSIGHIGDENRVSEADAGSTAARFRVTLSAPLAVDMTFDVNASNGSATAGMDYVFAGTTMGIPAGSTFTTPMVIILDDALSEGIEDFTISITNPSAGVGLGTSSDTGFIVDDDPLPRFSINDVSVVEGNGGTTNAIFTISLSAASGQTVSVQAGTANDTATAGTDYVAVPAGPITFTPGETALFFPVTINGDTAVEPDETFFVNLSGASNATITDSQGVGTIQNDDAASSVTINDVSLVEGNAGSSNFNFTVNIAPASPTPVVVDYATSDISAAAGSDYQLTSGSLPFSAGQTSRVISVPVNGDTVFEPDETFHVTISTVSPGAVVTDPQGVGTIQNDDPQPSISIDDVSVVEGDAGTQLATFTVSLSGPSSQAIAVDYATAGVSAAAGIDFQSTSGTVNFSAGQVSRTVTVQVNGDNVFEPDETFTVDLSAAVNASIVDNQGVGTIQNDDPQPSVTIDDVSVVEGDAGTTNATFTVSLSNPSVQAILVGYDTVGVSATVGTDFQSSSGGVTFNGGEVSRTVTVLINGDTVFEPDETFHVNLTSATNATIVDNQGLGTIQDDDGMPGVSINDVSVVEGNAGMITAIFTLTLSNPSAQTITVDYFTADVTATAGSDYVAESDTLTFLPGVTSIGESVVVLGDLIAEGDETYHFNLISAMNATIADNQGVGTIQDDEPLPAISISDVALAEGDAGTVTAAFNVTLSNPSAQTITVNYAVADGSATLADSDYQMTPGGTLTFPPGQVAQTVNVAVNGDTVFEGNETFTVDLSGATNATIADNQGVGTINNDDGQPTISIADVALAEGNAGTSNAVFNVTLSNLSSQAITVNYTTADGTALIADNDYQMNAGTVTFNAGQAAQTITVLVNGDLIFEADETFNVDLSGATNATIADIQAVGTIQNDDPLPLINIDDVSVVEGNAGTTNATFTVSLSNPSFQAIAVDYATAGVSATAGTDFQSTSGTLNFSAGQVSRTVTVQVNGDTVSEADETFNVNLASAVNATIADNQGLGTIQDDDAMPGVSINDVSVVEGNAGTVSAIFSLTLSNPSAQTITVDYTTANVTATAGSDYVAESGTLTFLPGQTVITEGVDVLGDLLTEGDETFHVNLSVPTNATIADNQGVGTIQDDDPLPAISISDVAVAEGDAGTVNAAFNVTLSNPSAQTITVNYAVADGSATLADSDYQMTPGGTLTFPPGQVAQAVNVTVNGDTVFEGNETFTVDLSGAANATIADNQGVGTINNDDGQPTISIADVAVAEGNAGTSNAIFNLSLSNPSAQAITVNYTTADGTALIADNDYQLNAGTVTFTPGQTAQAVTAVVNGDVAFEPDESFTVDLSGATNATIADAQAVGTIQNDDGLPTISITDPSVVEGNAGTANLAYTISLSNPSAQTVNVDFTTADGTAMTADNDYQTLNGTATFTPGQTVGVIIVQVNGDLTFEADETVLLDLTNPTNATIADNQGVGTIQNDDGQPSLSIDDVSLAEGDAGQANATFTVTLSSTSAQTVNVDFVANGGTATVGVDFDAASGTLTWNPGQTVQTLNVAINGDLIFEGDETLTVDLANPVNATIADNQGVGTIQDDDSPPAIAISDANLAEGNAGASNMSFNVTLTNPSAQAVTVDFATADGSATLADSDYQNTSGTLTFTPGQTALTIQVPINGDGTFEPDETFDVDLSNPGGGSLADAQGVGTILNDDGVPSMAIDNVTLVEGNAGTVQATFTVSLTVASAGTVTVDFITSDGTASVADNDYAAVSGTLSFAPGQVAMPVMVPVSGDGRFEPDESFTVDLSNVSGASLGVPQGTGTIQNDDPLPAASIDDINIAEGNSGQTAGTFTVSLSNPSSQPVNINFATADDSATLGDNDYQMASGTVSFAPDELSRTLAVQVNGDTTFEVDEAFFVNLSGAMGATLADAQGVGTILNDDGVPSISIGDVSVAEGDAGQTTANLAVTLTIPSAQPVTVDWATGENTATLADGDFQPGGGSLFFAPGETTLTVAVQVLGDLRFEPDESFFVNLTNEVGGSLGDPQGEVTITNDDALPALSISDANLAEGNAGMSNMSFDVTLDNPSAQVVTVDFATADGSATLANNDYQNTSGTLTFSPGQTALTIQVPINGDPTFEPDEAFDLNLSNPSGGSLADAQGVGTILNDDGMPSMAIDNVTLAEGNAGTVQATFTVILTVASVQAVTADFITNDDTANAADNDYGAVSGTLTFAPGQTVMTIAVPVFGDGRFETDESFTVDLSNVSGASLGVPQGRGTIQNDDPLPAASIDDINIVEGNSGQTAGTFTISLSNPSALPVDINLATADDTASVGDNDYQMAAGMVSFAPDETSRIFTVQVNGDTTFEGDEAFFVDLSGSMGATLADAQGVGTILNDDGVPSIVVGDVSVAEGDAGQTTASLAVTLTIPSAQPVTVDWTTGENTATLADSDFQPGGGSLFFAPGETALTLAVQVLGDLRFEPDESFFINLTNAVGGSLGDPQGEVTIINDDALPALTIDDLVVAEGDAGTQTATFTVALSNLSAQPVTVGFATSDGGATVADGDYTDATGILTFAPGTLTQPVDVQVLGDTVFEGDEVFFVDLQSPSGATLGDGQGQLTIVNDDAATIPSFVINDVQVTEGDSGTVDALFTVTLAAPDTAAYSVDYATTDGTASAAGGDYTATAGTLTLSANGGFGTQTVRVVVQGDTLIEGNETFSVVLTNPSGGAVLVDDRGEATIEDDDQAPALVMNIGDITVAEGDTGTTDAIFTLGLSAPPTAPVTVNFATVDGSATAADGDYQQKSGVITFNAGQQSRTVTVFVNGDTRVEGDETFTLLLTNPSGAVLGDDRGEAIVLDDDSGGVPTLTIRDGQRDEGDAGSQDLLFEVSLTPPSTNTVTVDYSTTDGSATVADGDYDPASGQLTFVPGDTLLTLAVPVRGDLRQEGDETFFVDLSNPSSATLADNRAVGTIVDDDDSPGGPQPALSISNARVNEGDSGSTAARFTVTLSTPSAQSVSVTYTSRDGSAQVTDGDYQPTSGQLTLAPGQQSTVLTVPVNGDLDIERDEVFFVDLSNAVGATLADPEGRGLINNDDLPLGQVRLVAAGPVSESDGKAVVEVERFGPTGRAVEVTVQVSAGTATAGEDFTALSAAVRWSANERGRRSVEVTLVDDNRSEAEETLLVQLSNPVNATLEAPSELELVILDDDQATGLEVVGEREFFTEVRQGVTLEARVVGQDGAPIAGAAVAWRLDGDAELESGETTLSDDEGLVSQRLTLGRLPGRVRVTAALVDGDAEVIYTIVAEGNLGTAEQGSETLTVADVLDRSCVDAQGMLRSACEYVYTLPSGAQQRVLTELDPVAETQAQSDLSLQAPQTQLRNITARLSALRGGAVSQVVEQLAFNIQGDPVSLGMVRSAVADYGKDHNRYAAALQTALDRARGLDPAAQRGGAASSDEQYADVESAKRWGAFLNGSASFGDRPQISQELGFDFETQGITAGVDVRLSDRFVLGVAAGFLDTDIDVARDGGGVDASGYALSLYGTYYRERYYIDGIATYGWSDYDLVRNLDLPQPFMGRSRYVARAEPGGEQISFGLGGGYDFQLATLRLTTFARGSYVDAEIDAYTERGAGPFNLRLGSQSITSLLSEAGVELAYPWSVSWGVMQPSLRASYLHEFDDDSRLVRGRFAEDTSGNEFVVETGRPDRDFFNLGVSISFVLPRDLSFFILYDTDLERDDLDVYTLSGGVRYQF